MEVGFFLIGDTVWVDADTLSVSSYGSSGFDHYYG